MRFEAVARSIVASQRDFPMTADSVTPAGYEVPCIEQVLTAEELDRELHYAGGGSIT